VSPYMRRERCTRHCRLVESLGPARVNFWRHENKALHSSPLTCRPTFARILSESRATRKLSARPLGLVPRNALVLTDPANFRVVGNPEVNRSTLAFKSGFRILRGFCYPLLELVT